MKFTCLKFSTPSEFENNILVKLMKVETVTPNAKRVNIIQKYFFDSFGAKKIPVVKVIQSSALFNSNKPNFRSFVKNKPTRYTPQIEIKSQNESPSLNFDFTSFLKIEKKTPLRQIKPEKMLTNDFEYGKLNTKIENKTIVDISLIFNLSKCGIFSLIDWN
jgi:hypothetical protein